MSSLLYNYGSLYISLSYASNKLLPDYRSLIKASFRESPIIVNLSIMNVFSSGERWALRALYLSVLIVFPFGVK